MVTGGEPTLCQVLVLLSCHSVLPTTLRAELMTPTVQVSTLRAKRLLASG